MTTTGDQQLQEIRKCANCYQPIRETEPRDGIEAHDGEYEFRYVHEDGNPVCDGLFTATPPGRLS